LRTVGAGNYTLCSFGLAVNTKRDKGKEEVLFVNCNCWGKRGEALAKYLTKGSPVFIEGRLQSNKKDDKIYFQVNVENFQFIPKSNQGSQAETGQSQAQSTQKPSAVDSGYDDIPF